MMTSNLNYAFSWSCWRAVQEAIIIGVPLGEAEPLWEVWEILPVALKNHGVIVQTSSLQHNNRQREEERDTYNEKIYVLSLFNRDKRVN